MHEGSDIAIADLMESVPADRIPAAISLLAARLLRKGDVTHHAHHGRSIDQETRTLLTASELAKHLRLPETWVRNAERLGRIPGVRMGKYVRFRLDEVEKALAERVQLSPKSRSL